MEKVSFERRVKGEGVMDGRSDDDDDDDEDELE